MCCRRPETSRRQLLGAVGGVAVAGLAGCLGDAADGGDDSPDDETGEGALPTAVTYSTVSAWTPPRALEIADGQVTYRWDCYDDEDQRYVEHETTAEFTRADNLRALMADADPAAWESYYDCMDVCPTDLPSKNIRLELDDEVVETGVYSGRTEPIPDGLRALVEFLATELDRFDSRPCE